MEQFSLYYPVKPHKVNQEWGVYRPDLYAQFGFTRHNGQDIHLVTGQDIRAPIAGDIVMVGWEPKGAGVYVILRTREQYLFPDGVTAYAELSFFHMQRVSVVAGQYVQTGEILGPGNSTGFSSGPHLHLRLRRLKKQGERYVHVDTNEAQNTIDAEPYMNGVYADTQTPQFHYQFTRDLSFGLENKDVYALQTALQIYGTFPKTQTKTEFYGNVTRQAVRDFQKRENIVSFGPEWLTGYGRLGPKSRALLNFIFI